MFGVSHVNSHIDKLENLSDHIDNIKEFVDEIPEYRSDEVRYAKEDFDKAYEKLSTKYIDKAFGILEGENKYGEPYFSTKELLRMYKVINYNLLSMRKFIDVLYEHVTGEHVLEDLVWDV